MLAELLEWEFVAQLLVGKREIQKSTHLQWNAGKKSVCSQISTFPQMLTCKCFLPHEFKCVIILVTHRRAS